MTRINLIPVEELSDPWLLAEHREIKRIPNVIVKGKFHLFGVPENYTLGRGHVKFFYNKLCWLRLRYDKLFWECHRRGFNVEDYSKSFLKARYKYPELDCDWTPTDSDIEISRSRLREKYQMKPDFYKWTGRNKPNWLDEGDDT
jgi:deoxyribonuclease (pyrimidine dimer)